MKLTEKLKSRIYENFIEEYLQKNFAKIYFKYAVKAKVLPSPEILMKKAKASIRRFEEPMQSRQLADYEDKWSEIHPYHYSDRGDVYAQLGGWPVTWSDEAATDQLHKKLVLRTYADSEPWIEVFKRGQKYECISRIT